MAYYLTFFLASFLTFYRVQTLSTASRARLIEIVQLRERGGGDEDKEDEEE
jgi:hypothetical protein